MRHHTLFTTGFVLLLALSGIAIGKVPSNAQSNDTGLKEVVVTASKRAEPLQKVPVAVTVVSGEDLQRQNIAATRDLQYLVPSLILGGSNTSSYQETFQVRGVGTQVNVPTLAQSVSVVLDGMTLDETAMGRSDFADIQSIQVLQGPQGMLFGKNSDAGAVVITTNPPKLNTYEAVAHLSYGDTSDFAPNALGGVSETLVQLTGNAPLGSHAAVRVNTYYDDQPGYLLNKYLGRRLNGYNDKGVRVKLLWRPTDNLKINLTGDYSQQYDPYRDATLAATVPGSPIALLDSSYGFTAAPDNNKVLYDAPQDGHSKASGAVLRVEWLLGDYMLTSTSGYRNYTMENYLDDLDASPFDFLDRDGTNDGFDQVSQELQLTSPADRTVEYVAGALYDHFVNRSDNEFAGDLLAPLPSLYSLSETWHYHYRTNSAAVYGQATIHLANRFRFIAGGRLTHDHNSFNYEMVVTPGALARFPVFPLVPNFYSTESATNFSWRVGPQYDFTPRTMGYAVVSTGYKSPGFDSTTVGVVPGADQVVHAETSINYEIGLKSSWLDRRLIANLDAFIEDFRNFQTQLDIRVPPDLTILKVANAPGLRSAGFGLDLAAEPTNGLRINANVAYTDAYFTSFPNAACYPTQTAAQGCNPATGIANATGKTLPEAPKWITSVGGTYNWPISSSLNGLLGVNWYYRTKSQYSAAGDPKVALPGYGIFGALVGIEDSQGRWRLSLSGKNLFNRFFPTEIQRMNAVIGGPGAISGYYYSRDVYRTIYLNLDIHL